MHLGSITNCFLASEFGMHVLVLLIGGVMFQSIWIYSSLKPGTVTWRVMLLFFE